MDSFKNGTDLVVIGATGGIGRALVDELCQSSNIEKIFACSRTRYSTAAPKIHPLLLDLENENSIAEAADSVRKSSENLRLVIVAAGVLHAGSTIMPEKTWRELDPASMELVWRINTIGPALVAKHFLPLLPRHGRSVFAALSARVGSISDNRLGGWHSYRASKAALNMLLRNFAIELKRKAPDAVCIGLHPGTVDTALSEPFQANVPSEQLFEPAYAASRLIEVINNTGPDGSGNVYAWDGTRIPE